MLARLWPLCGVGGSRATARTSVPGGLLKGGTSTSWPVSHGSSVSTPCLAFGGGGGGTGGWGGAGLARCWVLRERALLVWGVCVSSVGRFLGRTVRRVRVSAGCQWVSGWGG